MHRRFLITALIAGVLPLTSAAEAPAVLNVRADQIEMSDFVDVYYDLQGDESKFYNVTLEASSDNGLSWGVRVRNVSGDTGLVLMGPNKHIIWDAGRDYAKQFSTNFRVKVVVLNTVSRQRVCPDADDEGMVLIRGKASPTGKNANPIPDFCVDKWEFPNKIGDYPLVFVHYRRAEEYCRAGGKRLCTGAQWEIACTGGREIGYPYGAEYSKKRCNTEGDTLFPIGTNLACVSLHGVYDLSGNAYEWVAPEGAADRGGRSAAAEVKTGSVVQRPIRGGNWYLGGDYSKCSKGGLQNADYATRHTGFRCCYSF